MNAELIKAVRRCGNFEDRDGCDEECPYFNDKDCPKRIMCDAADALEEADKRIDGLQKLVDINTERCEALRKQLREAHESYEKHINELTTKCNQLQAEVDNYEKRIAELEAQIPKGGEWISVEDRLPEDLGCVLTANKWGDCTTLWWNDRGWWDNESGYYCCRDYIKYWMELPEPPNCGARMKGENDEQTDC